MSRIHVRGVAGVYADSAIAPAGRIAAVALMRPSVEFMVETTGWYFAVGQNRQVPTCPLGTTVTFKE